MVKNYYTYIISFFLLVGTLSLHIAFMPRAIFPGDTTEFVAVIASRGVAHPPGYPLFTLMGHAANFLLPFESVAFKTGLVSAFFGAATVASVFLIIYELTKKRLPALFGSIMLALSGPFFLYSLVAEVFTLHTFILSLIILLALKFLERPSPRFIYATFFMAGLGISNHHTIIFVIPALVFIFWRFLLRPSLAMQNRSRTATIIKTSVSALFFLLLGMVPYLSIPIFAQNNPLVNWENAINFQNLANLFLRKYYGSFTLSPAALTYTPHVYSVNYFLKFFTTFWGGIPAFLAAFGAICLAIRKRWNEFTLFILTFVLMGPFFFYISKLPMVSVNTYAAMERFLIAPLVIIWILAGVCVAWIMDFEKIKQSSAIKYAAAAVVLLLFVFPAKELKNFDLRASAAYSDISRETLELLPQNAIYLTVGDYFSMPADFWRTQGVRGDVRAIDVMKISRQWYRDDITRRFPELSPFMADSMKVTVRNLCREFAAGVPGAPDADKFLLYASSWLTSLEDLSDACLPIQAGMLIKIYQPDTKIDIVKYKADEDAYWNEFFARNKIFDSPKTPIYRIRRLYELVADAHNRTGAFYAKNGEGSLAKESYLLASRVSPDHVDSVYNLALLGGEGKNYEEALNFAKQGIKRNPEHLWSYLAAGVYANELGLKNEARAYLNKFLGFKPDPTVHRQVEQAEELLRSIR